MKKYAFQPNLNDPTQYYYFEQGFSKEELDAISRGVSNLPFEVATTGKGIDEIRKSKIKWIPQTSEWDWLYDKLMQMAVEANDTLWHFDLTTAPEFIQYTEYHASDNGKYEWHQDIGPHELSVRKVSITVQLSDDYEYDGGDLKFFMGGETIEGNTVDAPRGIGTVVIFPSYMYHAVKPVTQGVRKSFVLWLGGGHYK